MPKSRPAPRAKLRLTDFLLVGAPLAALYVLFPNLWVRVGLVSLAVAAGAAVHNARTPRPSRPAASGTFYEFDAEKLAEWCDSAQLRAAAPHVRHLLVLRTTRQGVVKCLLFIESDTNSALLEFSAPAPAIAALRAPEEEDPKALMHRFTQARLLPRSPD